MNLKPFVIPMIVGLIVLLLIIGGIYTVKSNKKNSAGSKDKTENSDNIGGKPAMFTESYPLSSTPETHDVYVGYRCKISGGGKQYYRSLNDGPEELRGGPNNKYLKSGDDIQSFTIRKYEGENAAEKITATYYSY